VEDYTVHIVGLSVKVHRFDFTLNEVFFEKYGSELLRQGSLDAVVMLDKRETMLEADFAVKGSARLVCDRSLEEFDYPLDLRHRIVFKYGHEEAELDDDIMVITRDHESLDLGQYLYELICVSLPMKRLHPRFSDETNNEEDTLVYRTQEAEETIDPRWEKLKSLKK